MNIPEEKSDLSQISLTGVRALTMLRLLEKAPRSLEEIREKFLEEKLIDSKNSNDILRIDMNTLRSVGCEISRASRKTNHKYEMTKHPFGLSVTSEEVSLLKKAYKIIKKDASIKTLLEYHFLFGKIAGFVFDKEIKENILGISVLKSYNILSMAELERDCRLKNIITIEYLDGGTSKIAKKNILAENLSLRSNKVYLFGHDTDSGLAIMYPVKRIKKVLSRKASDSSNFNSEPVEVKFCLKNFNSSGLEKCESITELHEDGSQIISGKYHNEFVAVQRMLSFGPACIVLEPASIKQKVIDKLLKMREVYKND